MIRRAEEKDFASIREIWLRCFSGDRMESVNFFLDGCFAKECCMIYELDGRVVSMLHLLPLVIRCGDSEYPAQYLYAAATLPQYRFHGLMAELLDAAREQGKKDGCAFTLLLPASESLVGYYARAGYETATARKDAVFSSDELRALVSGTEVQQPVPLDEERLARQMREAFSYAVYYCNGVELYTIKEWLITGGQILSFTDGALFYRRAGDRLFVKEIFGRNLPGMLQILCARELPPQGPVSSVSFRLAPEETRIQGGKITPFGMLQTTERRYSAALESIRAAQVYFNWALE